MFGGAAGSLKASLMHEKMLAYNSYLNRNAQSCGKFGVLGCGAGGKNVTAAKGFKAYVLGN